jgi:hypothetical protein
VPIDPPFNSSATAGFVLRGETPEGVPIYALDLGIPQGKPGQDGNGAEVSGETFFISDSQTTVADGVLTIK